MEPPATSDSVKDEDEGNGSSSSSPIKELQLPQQLEAVTKASEFPTEIHRWYTNEEVAAILIAFSRHEEWQSREPKIRPPSGSMLLYNRKKVRYRQDGYCWKKRKDGKTTREDHMKLKVQGVECIYGCYVHSAILPTFHRRSYWLLQNPDIVLLHYLNVPLSDDNKTHIPPLSLWAVDKKEWSKEELQEQLRPMYVSMKHTDPSNVTDEVMEESVNSIVKRLLATQTVPQPCSCPGSSCTESRCKQRIISPRRSLPSAAPPRGRLVSLLSKNKASGAPAAASTAAGRKSTPAAPPSEQGGVIRQVAENAPLILNLSQLQGSNGMVILSSQMTAPFFVNNGASQADQDQGQGQGQCQGQCHNQRQGQGQVTGRSRAGSNPKPKAKSQPQRRTNRSAQSRGQGQQGQGQSDLQGQGQSTLSSSLINANGADKDFDIFNLMKNPDQHNLPSSNDLYPVFADPNTSACSEQRMDVSNIDNQHYHGNTMVTTAQPPGFHSNDMKEESGTAAQNIANDHVTHVAMAAGHTASHGDSHSHVAMATTQNSVHQGTSTLTTSGVSAVEDLVAELNMKNNLQDFDPNVHLTHADIQEALAATLATHDSRTLSSQTQHDSLANASIDEALRNSMVSPHSADLNFDAFDILDLADLDTDHLTTEAVTPHSSSGTRTLAPTTTVTTAMASTSSASNISCANCLSHAGQQQVNSTVRENRAGIANITDFSPEWAYPEGGSKVLVTGPWYSTTSPYTVQFDGVTVQATLVQSGVLRCYTPAHAPGVVTLQVSCEGFIISNTCYFEFKCRESSASTAATRQQNWFTLPEEQLKMTLLSRLGEVEKRLAPKDLTTHTAVRSGPRARSRDIFEDKLLEYCERLSEREWVRGSDLVQGSYMRLTLLHLVAALGYSRLINTLIKWRSEKQCLLLEYEVDALSMDENHCTPLTWACAYGRTDAALVLYHWNSGALSVPNKDGLLPLSVARKCGNLNILHSIEGLELARLNPVRTGTPERGLSDSDSVCCHLPQGKVTFTPPQPVRVQVKPVATHAPADPHQMAAAVAAAATTLTSSTTDWSIPLSDLTIQIPSHSAGGSARRHDSLPSSLQCTPVSYGDASDDATSRRLRLMKRTSVEVLPDYPATPFGADISLNTKCSKTESNAASGGTPGELFQRGHVTEGLRSVNSDPHLVGLVRPDPMISVSDRDLYSPLCFMNTDLSAQLNFDMGHVAMETDSPRTSSPTLSVDDNLSSVSQMAPGDGDDTTPPQMMALANQIIAAMPERIKLSPSRGDDLLTEEISSRRDRSSSYGSFSSCSSTATPPCVARDSGISTPLEGMAFEEYRYPDLDTPASSLSPASSCLHSPYSFSFDSFPPTTAEFTEYFNAPNFYMEKDFSQLTLSDEEQRRLYEAAKIIQSFYRKYKDQKELQRRQRQKEIEAAILIQSYYRRYKQYMYYKKMSQAAILIQSQFRTYYAQKRFKMSREAATIIQNRYRAYKQQERYKKSRNAAVLIQQRFRSHYQRKRNQQDMARKVQEMVEEPGLNSDSNDSPASAARSHSTSASSDEPHSLTVPPGEQTFNTGGATSNSKTYATESNDGGGDS